MALEDEELLQRQVPQALEAEQSVLGSMLIDERCVPDVVGMLQPDDFYLRQNREIYETIYSMFNYSLTIDPVTVLENMRKNGVYDENVSRNYILQLMDTTPTAANVGEYVAIIKDKTLLRRIAETAGDMTAMVQQGTDSGQDVLEAAEQRIYAIRQGRAARGLTPISAVLLDVYDRLNELAASDAAVPGLSTGLGDLDLAISGLNKSDLILLAARPGMGKTSMALNILLHAGKFFQDCSEVLSVVTGEGSGYVLPNSESWVHSICRFPHFLDDSHSLNKKTGSFSGKSRPTSRNGQILARTAERDAVHRLDFITVDFCYISQMNHTDLISFCTDGRHRTGFPAYGG